MSERWAKLIAIVMGVSGSGKTTVGMLLAAHLECKFADADDYHPSANVAKMCAGTPLNDADRAPWLDVLRELIRKHLKANQNLVLACSALKAAYREHLGSSDDVKVIYLKGDYDLFAERLRNRIGHYMPPRLLDSQFDTLEEPHDALIVDATKSPEAIVAQIKDALSL